MAQGGGTNVTELGSALQAIISELRGL
jgi:hypothetical protein